MTIRAYGDRAVLINFGQVLDPAVNAQVHQLNRQLQALELPGITYTIPAFCSLTVGFDPDRLQFAELRRQLEAISLDEPVAATVRRWNIPVCYEAPYGLDWEFLCRHCGQTEEALIQLHSQQVYTVYMLGFLPGFAYLGPTPAALACPRKDQPRRKVPAGSVGLAGRQTGIYPVDAPGGWQIIGRSPLPFFMPKADVPILFQPGDQVQFEAISKEFFVELEARLHSQPFDRSEFYV
ncbi:MAG: 5-oxoprolinase subunit PxpB [Phaeodactylibacter sp.]|nr:5-oxoprolinase subunit PxpB [Phaeodactylibacter sp.]